MIKAIIFDFFGVIGVSTYQLVVEDIELTPSQQAELTDLHRAFDHGFMTEPDFMRGYAQILNLSDEDFVNRYYMAQSKFSASQKLLDLVGSLKTNYKVALLSNVGEESYHEFIKPIEHHFDVVVTSFSAQLAKPDTAIFGYTADLLKVNASECLMIDDSYNNCEGARAAGMEAIQYDNFDSFSVELNRLINT
jgi:HAD superfamily hydrolase (TIGR01509 family)